MMSEIKTAAKKINVIKLFLRLLPLGYRACPLLFISINTVCLIQGVTFGFIAMINQRFFDSAANLAEGTGTLDAVLLALFFMFLINVAAEVLNTVYNSLPPIFASIGARETSSLIQMKLRKIDPVCFERTEFLDSINKAKAGRIFAFQLVFKIMIIFTFYIPYFITMGLYLFSVKPLFIIMIVIVFVPPALTQIIRTRVFSRLEDNSAPVRRENDYYEECIVSKDYFKETRLLGSFKYFLGLFKSTLHILNRLRLKAELKTSMIELTMNIFSILGYFGILFMLFTSLMAQEITVGMFAAVYANIGMMFGMMYEIILMHLGGVSANTGAVNNIVVFLDHEERTGEHMTVGKDAGIIAENISFKYPGSSRYAIKDISFRVRPKETIAIVGKNGSGKSTLIKLITGLYLPEQGSVYINEIDTRRISMETLFDDISAVFQKYQKYKLLLKENIAISDMDNWTSEQQLDRSCEKAGFDKEDKAFDSGYDTMMSREFGGVEISGGQWQKVAIARGFHREHQLIVLDEPTAAIDPIEETKIYDRFSLLSKDKTAFIVTHRLGSVRLADRILVLSDGELAEMGTHEELMEKNGEYARMYKSQRKWYV